MNKEIHIGEIIQNKMEEDGRSASWLAKNMNCDRTNIYKIFKKQNIDVQLLLRISIFLKFDFFIYYSDIFREKMKEKQINVDF